MNLSSLRVLTFLSAFLFSLPGYSTQVFCTGKVKSFWINGNGGVIVDFTWSTTSAQVMCTLVGDSNVNAQACGKWVSVIQSAFFTNHDVVVMYNDPAYSTCAAFPSWPNSPVPAYMRLNSTTN